MKKAILLLIMCATLSVGAQWKTGEYVDDFGEKTGQEYKYQSVVGVFSNSATTNDKCTYLIQDDGETLNFNIYPYSRNHKESWLESKNGIIKIKTPKGDVFEVEAFFYKKGVVYFSKKKYTKIKEVLSITGEYTIVFDYTSSYSSNSYRFKIKI